MTPAVTAAKQMCSALAMLHPASLPGHPPMRQPLPMVALGATSTLPVYSGPLASAARLWIRRLSKCSVRPAHQYTSNTRQVSTLQA
jgi:hypothetical protein